MKKKKLTKQEAAQIKEAAAWIMSFGVIVSMCVMADHGVTDGRILIGPLILLLWALWEAVRQAAAR